MNQSLASSFLVFKYNSDHQSGWKGTHLSQMKVFVLKDRYVAYFAFHLRSTLLRVVSLGPRSILLLGRVHDALYGSLRTLSQARVRVSGLIKLKVLLMKERNMRAEGLEPSLEAWKATVLAITPCPQIVQKSFFCG